MHKFLQTPLTSSLPKFVLGTNPLFSVQPFNEEFTSFTEFKAQLLEQDWYFFQILLRLSFIIDRKYPQQLKLQQEQLTPTQILYVEYWDQMAKFLIQAYAPITPSLKEQIQTHNLKQQLKLDRLNRYQLADFINQATLDPEILPQELSAKVRQRLYLLLATCFYLEAPKNQLTLAQLEQAVTVRLLNNYLLQVVAKKEPATNAEQEQLPKKQTLAEQWVLVASSNLSLTPDWPQRLEVILEALEGRKQVFSHASLHQAQEELNSCGNELKSLWRCQQQYQQQYLLALESYSSQLQDLPGLESLTTPQAQALADRLCRTAVIALDNSLELEANFKANTGLDFVPEQSLKINLSKSKIAYPQLADNLNSQQLNFLQSFIPSCQGLYLVNLQALVTLKLQEAQANTQAYGVYAQVAQKHLSKLVQKINKTSSNYQLGFPYASPSLDPFAFASLATNQTLIFAQAQPSLGQVINDNLAVQTREQIALYHNQLASYNFSGNYVGRGYDYLATMKHLVLSYIPSSYTKLDLYNQLSSQDLNSYFSVNSQAQTNPLAVGSFYKQPHTVNFVPQALAPQLMRESQILAGNFFTRASLLALFKQLNQQRDTLAHDYLLITQSSTRFQANWYGMVNQQLSKIFTQDLPALIVLGGQGLESEIRASQVDAFLVLKAALPKLISELEAQTTSDPLLNAYVLPELVSKERIYPQAPIELVDIQQPQSSELITQEISLTNSQFKLLATNLQLTPKQLKQFVVSERKEQKLTAYKFNFSQLISANQK
ncbi:hypothetical protein [Psittacicella gerlachiana]|uniref:Uncharacterized protein n=1 Tax=Psittacicella gerlachiana TaxID=2028574 RepID=A0A3A1YFI2_9GAMM|nr:hypothetical protein [Psittacicella gerlachiana]RIY36435.1 hypothetical protein CKF59_02715 [Psittacicella gerlachiana]